MFEKLVDAARKDTRRAAMVVGAAVVLLLLVVGGRMAVNRNGRETTAQQAMAQLLDAESFHTVVDFDLNLPAPAGGQQRRLVDVAVDIEGDVQVTDSQPELFGDMRMETTGRGIILFADGNLRLLKDAVAFRLDNLPTILNPNGNLVERWTYVQAPALETRNTERVREVLMETVGTMEFVDMVKRDGGEWWRYRRSFTDEEEQALVEVIRQGKSGNRALHVLARLLRAYQVDYLEMVVDPEREEVREISMRWLEGEGESEEEAAMLALTFEDYGKAVAAERPPAELTVRPEVFARIFGQGEVAELE